MITQPKTVIRGINSADTIEHGLQDLLILNVDDSICIGTQRHIIRHKYFDPEDERIFYFVGPPAEQPPAPHKVSVGRPEDVRPR